MTRSTARTSKARAPTSSDLGMGTTAPATPAKGPTTDLAYLSHVFEPLPPFTLGAWTIDRIRAARDAHAQGVFEESALLADAMTVDPRIAAGLLQRLGPPLGIPRAVRGGARWNGKGLAETVRREGEAMFAESSPWCGPGTLAAGFLAAAMMGFAIMQNVARPRPDGSRVDFEVRPWPLQMSRWNEATKRYQVSTTDGLETVEPNDGKWIVIEPLGPRSFLRAGLRPLALLWGDRSYGIRDRSSHSAAHGSMSIVGTMPERVQIDSPEGKKFLLMLRRLQQARGGLVKPFGSAIEAFEAKTLAWQIFGQIVASSNADIMLVLNGIDNSSVYKPISQLDGVRYDLVRTDLGGATVGYNEGALRPWTRMNFGDDEGIRPSLEWLVPDPREQERVDALARRHQAFADTIVRYRKAGLLIDDDTVQRLAAKYKVDPPKLAPPTSAAGGDDVQPTEQQDTAQIRQDARAAS